MKKLFSFVAAALVAFCFTSCESNLLVVKIQANGENVVFEDNVAELGWWQLSAKNDIFVVNLTNADEVTTIPGKYTLEELDPEYTYIGFIESEELIPLEDGYVEITVSNNGKQVKAFGKFIDEDGITYELNLVYDEPTAKKTVNLTYSEAYLYDEYASEGLYAFVGEDEASFVQVAFWADNIQGHFTEDDFDDYYLGCSVQDAAGYHMVYTGTMDVTPGNGEGYYSVKAELLCHNSTMYKVDMTVVPGKFTAPKKAAPKKTPRKALKK